MIKSLWIKFLILLLAVSVVALSAAFLLRELMLRDFREYTEGEQEDRVTWVTADLENAYQTDGTWRAETVRRTIVWALLLGFESRLVDVNGSVVTDTERALESVPPLVKQKTEAIESLQFSRQTGTYIPYPLFLHGKEIGSLEIRFLDPQREHFFIQRSNTFLLLALGILGGMAVVVSIVFSNRLTRPLRTLSTAAEAISGGDLSRRVGVPGRDELGRLAGAFNRMAQTLETQESLRKKMISNVAHELRTPLTAIQGELEGMMDGLIPADKGQLQSIHEEAGRLKKMLEGMEELARAQASSLSLQTQEISVRPFLANIIDRMTKPAAEKQLIVSLNCDESTITHADPDRLSQIVINLLSNALRAVESGGSLVVSAGVRGPDFVLEVRDTGAGIKQEDLPFIFERFYKTSKGGLGIGLAIVRELVQAHGGRIEVNSEEGKGASFIVYLPG